MRMSVATWMILIIGLGTGVFMIANRVQESEKKIDLLNESITQEHENMRVLEADWTFLNSPERLEKVAKQYFELTPGEGRQYASIASVPLRAVMDEQEKAAADDVSEAEALAQIEPGTPDTMLAEDKTPAAPAAAPINALPEPKALDDGDITEVSDARGEHE